MHTICVLFLYWFCAWFVIELHCFYRYVRYMKLPDTHILDRLFWSLVTAILMAEWHLIVERL